jgi:16S rRNA processing protein RimM
MAGEIAVGRVGKPHGLKGWVWVYSLSGETTHFHNLKSVWLRGEHRERATEIEELAERPRGLVVKFRGIDTADNAAEIRGWELWVPSEAAAPRGHDEHYIRDLIGCVVECEGRRTGVVRAVWDSGAADMLEVELDGGGVRNVPFHREYVGEVDTDAGRIVVVYPDVLA